VYHDWYDKNNKHTCNDQFLMSRMNELGIEQKTVWEWTALSGDKYFTR
jgi:hypothetical protein